MKKNVIKEKSFDFAIEIVKAYKSLIKMHQEYVMSKQLLRCGTSVGALYREAEYAESKKDFIHKMGIAQKECNETLYWLELLYKTEYLTKVEFDSLIKKAQELMRLITSIIRTSKGLNN